METCTNCGAANRSGAKFCTSCGVRLPTLPDRTSEDWTRSAGDAAPQTATAAAAPAAPAATEQLQPPDTTSPASGSFWRDEGPNASDAVTADAAPARDTAEVAEEQPAADEPAQPAAAGTAPSEWSWDQPDAQAARDTDAPDDQRAADDEAAAPLTATGDDTEESTGGAAGDASSTLSSWASQWTGEYAAAPDSDGQRATGDVPAEEASPATGEPAEDAAAAWPAVSDEQGDEPAAVPDGAASAQSGLPSETGTGIEPPSSGSGMDNAAELDQSFATAGTTGGGGGANDAAQRAEQLLDELRMLLPVLAAAPSAGPTEPTTTSTAEAEADSAVTPPDATAVAAELAAAREGGDFADLRQALESAQNQPRDVDTMLDLVGRIEPMLAALDAHDRYAAAIDRAVDRLRGEDGEHAAGREDDGRDGFNWQSG